MEESESKQKKNIILLTGKITINPEVINTIKDANIRYNDYFQNIIFLLEKSDFDIIIFCENSNATLKDLNLILQLAKKNKKIFEFLPFLGNNSLGKGAGESEIIEYAIQNSKYIKNNDFYKLTGRRIVKNINHILYETKKIDVFFYKQSPFKELILTAFFKTNVDFFSKNLLNCGPEVDPTKWGIEYCLEGIYFNRLKKIKIHCPKKYPHFSGIAGKGIKLDKGNFKKNIKDILCFFGFYKI